MDYGHADQSQAIEQLRADVQTYRADLHQLVRLTDYFVTHPTEYAAWKAERAE